MGYDKTDQLAINTIRTLAVDATFNANSGHPGAPMGMAPVVSPLWHAVCYLHELAKLTSLSPS